MTPSPPAHTAERWRARTPGSMAARYILLLVPVLVCGLAVPLLATGVDTPRLVAVGAITAVGLVAGVWLWRVSNRTVAIALDGTSLVLGERGRHQLHDGSLHAARSASSAGGAAMGTVVFVRVDSGEVVSLVIPSLLPDDLYADDASTAGDLHVDADARADVLLSRLQPFVMPRDPGAARAAVPTYTMVLRGEPARSIQLRDGVVRLTDGLTGDVLAETAGHELATSVYVYENPAGTYSRAPTPGCLALAITFPRTREQLVVGAAPTDAWTSWDHLPTGPKPPYEVGYAELMRLADVSGAVVRR